MPQLVIDGMSIGRVTSGMLTEASVPHTAIHMTAGQAWRRASKCVNAAKSLMIANTAVPFVSEALQIAHRCIS